MAPGMVNPKSSFSGTKVTEETRNMIRHFDERQKNLKFNERRKTQKSFEQQRKPKVQKEEAPAYRDRYSEMKQYGFDLDYKDIMPENYDSLTAEETQLLGGDLEHTFLVKGVDQALLQKRMAELKQQEEEELKQQQEALAGIHSVMAQNIHNLIKHQINNQHKKEYFGPHLTTYEVQLDSKKENMSTVPSIISHSKYSCPRIEDYMKTSISESLMGHLTNSLKMIGQSSLKRQKKKKEEEDSIPVAADADMDIFSDIEESPDKEKQQEPKEKEGEAKKCLDLSELFDFAPDIDMTANQSDSDREEEEQEKKASTEMNRRIQEQERRKKAQQFIFQKQLQEKRDEYDFDDMGLDYSDEDRPIKVMSSNWKRKKTEEEE